MIEYTVRISKSGDTFWFLNGNNNHSHECRKEHESQHIAETPPSCFDRAERNGRVFDNCRFYNDCKHVKPICVDYPRHATPNVK